MTELTCSFRYKKSPPVLEVNCIQKISDRFHIYIVELIGFIRIYSTE